MEGRNIRKEDALSRMQNAKMLAEGYVYIFGLRPPVSVLGNQAVTQQLDRSHRKQTGAGHQSPKHTSETNVHHLKPIF